MADAPDRNAATAEFDAAIPSALVASTVRSLGAVIAGGVTGNSMVKVLASPAVKPAAGPVIQCCQRRLTFIAFIFNRNGQNPKLQGP